jgi:hypothetical protein
LLLSSHLVDCHPDKNPTKVNCNNRG